MVVTCDAPVLGKTGADVHPVALPVPEVGAPERSKRSGRRKVNPGGVNGHALDRDPFRSRALHLHLVRGKIAGVHDPELLLIDARPAGARPAAGRKPGTTGPRPPARPGPPSCFSACPSRGSHFRFFRRAGALPMAGSVICQSMVPAPWCHRDELRGVPARGACRHLFRGTSHSVLHRGDLLAVRLGVAAGAFLGVKAGPCRRKGERAPRRRTSPDISSEIYLGKDVLPRYALLLEYPIYLVDHVAVPAEVAIGGRVDRLLLQERGEAAGECTTGQPPRG